MEKKVYTIAIHVQRLKIILKKPGSLKKYCPATYTAEELPIKNWNYLISPCDVCRDFLNIESLNCPCHELGVTVARRRTLEAIKKYEKNKV